MKQGFFAFRPIIAIIIITAATANAQFDFGQNKIQYSQFDWQVLTTDHFEIYFYPQEKEIAETAAQMAEDSYNYLQGKFNFTVEKRVPFIVYSSPVFFEQTNIVPGILPENVAGFTEYYKRRVVIPFNGSLSDFSHVIRHELVHVFTFQKLDYVTKIHNRKSEAQPPLWFTEGIAEYWSQGWDNEADMFMRDLTVSGRIIPVEDLYSISGTFLMYKVGQSLLKFIGDTYGDDRLTNLFDNWWKGQDFDSIVKFTYGKSLGEIGDEWEYFLKKKYYPLLDKQDLIDRKADRLTTKGYNIKPTVFLRDTRDGRKEHIAFKSYRLGYSSIAEISLDGESAGYRTLIKGERNEKFESLHFNETGISSNLDGLIAFASKNQEKDVLYIYDTRRGEIVDKIQSDSLVSIASPSWCPSRNRIVFEGIDCSGRSDLYLYDMDRGKFTRLTSDIYADRTPAFSCTNENLIAFSSDRATCGLNGGRNLFIYHLDTGEITQLTFGDQLDETPSWTRTGDRIIFSSDRTGAMNIYVLDGVTNGHTRTIQMTNFITGAYDPVLAEGDSTVVFSAFADRAYNIYRMPLPAESAAFAVGDTDATGQEWSQADCWSRPRLKGQLSRGAVKYHPKFSVDIAQSVVSYDNISGSIGGLQMAMTDMLGNHQYYFLLSNTATSKANFLKSFNFGATYVNRSRRLNWGMGIFHFYNEYDDDYYGYVAERNYGAIFLASYPLSRYRRIESALSIRRVDKQTLLPQSPRATSSSISLSYVKDTSIWDPSGPIDGTRLNISVSEAVDVTRFKTFNGTLGIDYRKYIRLGARSAYATRLMYLHSTGEDPDRYYLGGSWSLRGYPLRFLYGRNIFLVNNELRFPLINNLSIGLPIGTMNFSAIRGALFFDAGNAWENYFGRAFGSLGFGFRVPIANLTVLRFDFARRTDFKTVGKKFNFDFFFGWDF
jgi:hypothetical protein